jgi:hypothetical protein
MKKIWQLVSLVPALGFAVFCSGDVLAAGATANGNLCAPLAGSFQYATVGVASGSDGSVTACAVPLDDQALPSSPSAVNFRAKVFDNSTTAGFSCIAYVHDRDGGLITSVGPRTTSVAGTGSTTFGTPGGLAWTATVAGNVNTNLYTIQCTMPGNYSVLYSQNAR